LGGPRYDQIFEKVLARTEAAAPRLRRRWLPWLMIPGAAVAAGVAALLVIARPRGAGDAIRGDPSFAARGAAGGGSGALEIGCGPAGGHVCREGGTLMFNVNTALAFGYLGAYAERIDDPAGERIWYFPKAAGFTPLVAPGNGTVVLSDGIQIGPEHRPGRYRVTVWISSRSLDRSEVDGASAGVIRDRATFELEVTP
jgi:hypothetical protein